MSRPRVVVVGSCNLDVILEVPALPEPGQTVLAGDAARRPGGKGANQAVAAARLGAATAVVGAVGTDDAAELLRGALSSAGVDISGLVTLDGPSGLALVLTEPSGENVIAVASGVNRRLRPSHLRSLEHLLDPDVVLLLQLETPMDTAYAAARAAHAAGAAVVLNAAPTPAPDEPGLDMLLTETDVLIVNAVEALALCRGARPAGPDHWRTLIDRLCKRGPNAVAITLGASGAVAGGGAGSTYVPAVATDAVDTTGAGDAFCGAVAAALAVGDELIDAVRLGCLAGALTTTAVGAQTAIPTRAQVRRFASSDLTHAKGSSRPTAT